MSDETSDEPLITLTGDTRMHEGEEQVRTVFSGADVWLPVEELRALVELLIAADEGRTAIIRPEIMDSMKRRIDEATGRKGLADSLFQKPPPKRNGTTPHASSGDD